MRNKKTFLDLFIKSAHVINIYTLKKLSFLNKPTLQKRLIKAATAMSRIHIMKVLILFLDSAYMSYASKQYLVVIFTVSEI